MTAVSRKKHYQVLGDLEEYAEQTPVKEASVLEEEDAAWPTITDSDARNYPEDVWHAATLAPDGGAAILRSYRDISSLREEYRFQLQSLTSRQSVLDSGTFTQSSNGAGLQKVQLSPLKGLKAVPHSPRKKTIAEQHKHLKDTRALARFDEQQQQWAHVVAELSARTLHAPEDLSMNTGTEWRARLETLDALHQAMPPEDRTGGTDSWAMSLRNAWERVVPVGSLFSGLFVTVRDSDPELYSASNLAARQAKLDERKAQQLRREEGRKRAGAADEGGGLLRVGRPLDGLVTPPGTLPALQGHSSLSQQDSLGNSNQHSRHEQGGVSAGAAPSIASKLLGQAGGVARVSDVGRGHSDSLGWSNTLEPLGRNGGSQRQPGPLEGTLGQASMLGSQLQAHMESAAAGGPLHGSLHQHVHHPLVARTLGGSAAAHAVTGGKLAASSNGLTMSKRLGLGLTRRGRDWAAGEVLRSRLDKYAQGLTKQTPQQPEMPSLLVLGESFVARLARVLAGPISMSEVEEHLAATDPDALKAYHDARDAWQACLAAEEEARAAAAAEAEAAQQPLQPGVHVEASSSSLLLSCEVGTTGRASFTLRNKGTCALTYSWLRAPVATPPLGMQLTGGREQGQQWDEVPHGVTGQQQGGFMPVVQLPCLHLRQGSGTLLPGAVQEFDVLFTPGAAGVFAETWTLSTRPALTDRSAKVHVSVRGIATPENTRGVAAASLSAQLAQREKEAKVAAVVKRLLANVESPAPAWPAMDADEEARITRFDAGNAGVWPPLYYPGQQVFNSLEQLYTEAWQLLSAALGPPPTPPGADSSSKVKSGKGGKKSAAPEPAAPVAPAITWPQEWSGSMQDLRAIIQDLGQQEQQLGEQYRAAAEAAQAAAASGKKGAAGALEQMGEPPAAVSDPSAGRLQTALSELSAAQSMHVPTHERLLLRHAMRAALGRAADAVETRLQAVHADYAQRAAEAEAAAAAGTPPAPGAPPLGPQVLADKLRAGTKGQVKHVVNWMYEEVAKEKAVVGDWLERAIGRIDRQLQVVQGGAVVALEAPAAAPSAPAVAGGELLLDASNGLTVGAGSRQGTAVGTEAGGMQQPHEAAGLGAQQDSAERLADRPDPTGLDAEGLYWAKFALLRDWSRLSIPLRHPPGIV